MESSLRREAGPVPALLGAVMVGHHHCCGPAVAQAVVGSTGRRSAVDTTRCLGTHWGCRRCCCLWQEDRTALVLSLWLAVGTHWAGWQREVGVASSLLGGEGAACSEWARPEVAAA